MLQGNQLSGTVPAWLAALPRLVVLDLSNNALTGTIPAAFGSNFVTGSGAFKEMYLCVLLASAGAGPPILATASTLAAAAAAGTSAETH